MKLVLIYRKQRPDAFSIEELFHTIARELRKSIDVIEYEAGDRRNLFRDIINLRKMNADIYHVTGDINYFVPFLDKKRTVLTVHDIGHYLWGLNGIKREVYKWAWLVWPIQSARVVTCISEETKQLIIKHLGFQQESLNLIENCYSPLFKHNTKTFNSKHPRILQVGTKSYKNVPRLICALKDIKCRLVLIGEIDQHIQAALTKFNIDYENHINITHEALVQQYIACDIVSFASIGEGFGVPIIEAQAVGRPLLTSNVSPLREVAGTGAACLVDPLSESSIRAGISRLIEDEAYRDDLVRNGLVNAQRFSSTATADNYLSLYKNIVNGIDLNNK